MNKSDNYDARAHGKRITQRVAAEIGKGVYPSDIELLKWWEKKSDSIDPRTFTYLIDVKASRIVQSAGFSVLGFDNKRNFHSSELLKMIHENQRLLVTFQTLVLYEICLDYPHLIKDIDLVYTTYRGVKNQDGKYLRCHQIGVPVQYDANGYVTKYYSSYRIIGDYNGEPLESQIFTAPEYSLTQKDLREFLSAAKERMLDVLGFTAKEQEILIYIANVKLNTKQLAEQLGRSLSTVRNHRTSINTKAKIAFPRNNFKDTEDVVLYLKQQHII